MREGIPHIAEAAERDRSQLTAHEVALRSQFSGLPTDELVARREALWTAADRETVNQERWSALSERIERFREPLEGFDSQRVVAEVLPRRERQEALARVEKDEARLRRHLDRLEAELREMPSPQDVARREFAVADRVLAERRELTVIAARISPPAYVKSELGERPSDPAKCKAWDRGVTEIERYRQEHGIKDPSKAFGRKAKRGVERARQETARRRLQEVQRVLGHGQHAARARQLSRGLSIGR